MSTPFLGDPIENRDKQVIFILEKKNQNSPICHMEMLDKRNCKISPLCDVALLLKKAV